VAINNPRQHYECRTCRAVWSDGRWTWGCAECGGGSMTVPCGFCLGVCGAVMNRAAMDSNDSGRAHFFGKCLLAIEPPELARRYQAVLELAKLAGAHTLELRVELVDWSNDEAWAKDPRGPDHLQVLLDAAAERNVPTGARAVAHALIDLLLPLPELPRMNLQRYWMSAGTVVVLEPTQQSDGRLRVFHLHRVISAARLWLSDPNERDLPCAGGDELVVGRRYLAIVMPTNMVPGMLIGETVETTGREAELIDLHRQLLARGENP
jgi:hypothetical protein